MDEKALVRTMHAWLDEHDDEMVADLQEMLRIPSIEGPAEPGAPFGKENRRALDLALKWASDAGMSVTDLEGYCGYAEFGSGDKQVLTMGHLDVVPVGPGWKHEPFGAEIDGGYVYCRGSSDDKGPTVAMFYAAKALQSAWPDIPVRVRSLFGCDEESGFKCVERYVAEEAPPTFGVAPDAMWPCVHAEKGISDFFVNVPLPKGGLTVLEVTGGQARNIVIDTCTARVRVADNVRRHIDEALAEQWDKNIATSWDGDVLVIEARGKAAHGSTPVHGDNAALRLFRLLKEISPIDQGKVFWEIFELGHIGGAGIGISGSDEPSGDLTCNLGVIETVGDAMRLTLNVRYPVTFKAAENQQKCEAYLSKLTCGATLESMTDSTPLYFPSDHPLVKAVVDVYEEEKGERLEPKTMGGGTYARAVPNCIAIGAGWPGDGPAHETDEKLSLENYRSMAKIYARVLVRLVNACLTDS